MSHDQRIVLWRKLGLATSDRNSIHSADKSAVDVLNFDRPLGCNPVLSFKGYKSNDIGARGFHVIWTHTLSRLVLLFLYTVVGRCNLAYSDTYSDISISRRRRSFVAAIV